MVMPWLDPLNLARPIKLLQGHRLDLRYWHVVDVWAIGARETQIVAPTWAKREWKILICFSSVNHVGWFEIIRM